MGGVQFPEENHYVTHEWHLIGESFFDMIIWNYSLFTLEYEERYRSEQITTPSLKSTLPLNMGTFLVANTHSHD